MRDGTRLGATFLRDSGLERLDLISPKIVHPRMGRVKRVTLWKYGECIIADSFLINLPFYQGRYRKVMLVYGTY
jgi:hypothetical protein